MARTIRKYPDTKYFCFRNLRSRQLQGVCEKYVEELRENGYIPNNRVSSIANGCRPNSYDDIPIASYGEVKHRLRNRKTN